MHEDLIGVDELDERPKHPLITHVRVKPLSADGVHEADAASPEASLAFMLKMDST